MVALETSLEHMHCETVDAFHETRADAWRE
jgi:hypothetical protein